MGTTLGLFRGPMGQSGDKLNQIKRRNEKPTAENRHLVWTEAWALCLMTSHMTDTVTKWDGCKTIEVSRYNGEEYLM